jgi:hypothetical protein
MMIGSTTPCPAEAGFRPLRAPLAHFHAAPAYPAAPAAIPGIHQRAYPQIESQPHARREAFAMTLPRSLRARLRALAPDDKELGLFLEDLAFAVRAETGNGYDISDSARFEAGLPLKPQVASPGPQAHMQALVRLPPAPTPGKHDCGRLRRHLYRAGRGRHCGIGKLGQAHPG